ncbi:MAG: glycosyltransferase [Candidatus Krumholzibacteria bacterium]|nr:glycosyltransferase [Candidatus Krumholzibacteria bacterium]
MSSQRPDVSIVIPVYNKLELTQVCVESIHRVPVAYTFEIIVVDNGSSDGTAEWLTEQENLGRVRRVDNPENLGFAQGCNLGAAVATGRYTLLLNNDMEVLPGWLEPMVSCLDQDPKVGITGACLIFADQTIQHGGVVLVDFPAKQPPIIEGNHLSYQKPVDLPGARNNHVVQVVTGACLMIRPELYRELDGLNEGFWNGNEDVDLCLRAGELGWQVVYMGDSLLYHYESQSGPERWSQTQANVELFNRIWHGRAKPDYRQDKNRKLTATADNQVRFYAPPNLLSRLPQKSDDRPRASVIVLTWNALDYTRQCAASLLKHTDARHELIFVDNGSRQDTLDYLAELEAAHPQVKVILNGENLGFAAGNNVGLAAATGDYLCLLNSDAVVTAGWVERLMRPLIEDERLGLVGPMTNSITGGQKLPAVMYNEDTLEGMPEFAANLAAAKAGQTAPALWVVGFCLMMRRELLLRVGGLDEGYGLGNYEDTDFCMRSFLSGFGAAVAIDCFIHHYGSRSFTDNDLDYGEMLDEKFEVFRRKWDLAPDARTTGDFQLTRLVARGFVPGLHFQPLPDSPHYDLVPLQQWQADQWVSEGEKDFGAGNLESARRLFEAVLARCPGHVQAGNDLAVVRWQSDTDGTGMAAAKVILEDILVRHPDNEDAQWNLAEIANSATEAVGTS